MTTSNELPEKYLNFIGKKVNNWIVLEHSSHDKKKGVHYFKAKCNCGSIAIKEYRELTRIKTTSCKECKWKVMKRNRGKSRTDSTVYRTWLGMRVRCYSKKSLAYPRYGGRGISISKEWGDFNVFLKDMGPKPARTSIDRIDNDGNYEKGNCRWATSGQQARNTSRSREYTHNGETMCITDWAKIINVKVNTLASFLDKDIARTIGDAIKYWAMDREWRNDFISKGKNGCIFEGELRSLPWIAKRLDITLGSLNTKKKQTSCQEAIDYFKRPLKDRKQEGYFKCHNIYTYKTFKKTAGGWSEYLKCDRHAFARIIKRVGFDNAIEIYDIPRKGRSTQRVANERITRVKLFTNARKFYNYNDTLMSAPEIASILKVTPQNLLKYIRSHGVEYAIAYFETPRKERDEKIVRKIIETKKASGVLEAYYFHGKMLTQSEIGRELNVPKSTIGGKLSRGNSMQQIIEHYEKKKK